MTTGTEYMYGDRIVTVIQYDSKRQRVEVIDSHKYRKNIAGFWVDENTLTTKNQ